MTDDTICTTKRNFDSVTVFPPFPNQRFTATLYRNWLDLGWSGQVMMKKYEPFVFFARHGFDSLLFRNSFLPGVWKNTEKSFWYCGWPGVASGFFLSDGKNVAAFSKRMNYNYIKHNNTVEHKLYQVMIDKDEYFIKHITSLHCGSISGESLVITTDDNSSVGNFDYWSHKLEWKFFDKHSHVLFLILIAYGFMRPQP